MLHGMRNLEQLQVAGGVRQMLQDHQQRVRPIVSTAAALTVALPGGDRQEQAMPGYNPALGRLAGARPGHTTSTAALTPAAARSSPPRQGSDFVAFARSFFHRVVLTRAGRSKIRHAHNGLAGGEGRPTRAVLPPHPRGHAPPPALNLHNCTTVAVLTQRPRAEGSRPHTSRKV